METNKAKDANKLARLFILKVKEGWDKLINTEARYEKFIKNVP